MPRPRVLIFSLAFEPFFGGAEVAVKEITKRLPDFEFEIISADITNFWSKYTYPIWAFRQAVKQHRLKPYDTVWAIMANQAGMAASAFKKRFPEVKFLLTLQEGDELNSWPYRLRLLGPRLWRVFKRPDQIQVISNYLGKWAREMGAQCPITVIPNGVDIEKLKAQSSKSNVETQIKTVITTSRLVYKNGVDNLIESLRYLPENIRLKILGSGPLEQELKLLTTTYNLQTRVEFVGHVPPEQVAYYLVNADVFVRASRSEGLGNSFLEAMAAGLPTVGTPVGGIPDFLHDRETGFLCRVDDPESIANQVKFILDPANIEKVDKIKANALKLVETNYTWSTIANQMTKLLL